MFSSNKFLGLREFSVNRHDETLKVNLVNGGARIEVLFGIVLDYRLEVGINLSVHDIAYLLEGQRLPWMD